MLDMDSMSEDERRAAGYDKTADLSVSSSLRTAVVRGVGAMGTSLGQPPDVTVLAVAVREGDAKVEYATNAQKFVVQKLLHQLLASLEIE